MVATLPEIVTSPMPLPTFTLAAVMLSVTSTISYIPRPSDKEASRPFSNVTVTVTAFDSDAGVNWTSETTGGTVSPVEKVYSVDPRPVPAKRLPA